MFCARVRPVHQEQIAACEVTENIAEFPVVHEQVFVGLRQERLVDARGPQGGLERPSCPPSEAPLLSPVAIPCLGGGADGVDVTTTRFLLGMAFLADGGGRGGGEEEGG